MDKAVFVNGLRSFLAANATGQRRNVREIFLWMCSIIILLNKYYYG